MTDHKCNTLLTTTVIISLTINVINLTINVINQQLLENAALDCLKW